MHIEKEMLDISRRDYDDAIRFSGHHQGQRHWISHSINFAKWASCYYTSPRAERHASSPFLPAARIIRPLRYFKDIFAALMNDFGNKMASCREYHFKMLRD